MDDKDIIGLSREIGHLFQQDDVYHGYQIAKQIADDDQELQDLITEFNRIRTSLSDEATKPDGERDIIVLKQLEEEMHTSYAKIMSNQSMIGYNEAKDRFDALLNRVLTIIRKSAEGEDPDTADLTPSCTGSCSTCGGCG